MDDMGLIDSFKRYIRGEDYDEDYADEGYNDFTSPDERENRWSSRGDERGSRTSRSDRSSDSNDSTPPRTETPPRRYEYSRDTNDRVVSIHTVTQVSVVLVKPEKYEKASEIADHLKDKRTVVLNLEQTNRDIARRLVDFLSGVAYANEGNIKKVANSTYIITPYNVDIQGDIIDELENNGLYL
jgi:cell division inhibitor SepF